MFLSEGLPVGFCVHVPLGSFVLDTVFRKTEMATFLLDSLFLHIWSRCPLPVKLAGVVLAFLVVAVYLQGTWGPGRTATVTKPGGSAHFLYLCVFLPLIPESLRDHFLHT